MFCSLVSAVPQVIFSDINLTISSSQVNNITTGNYRIWGEGIDASTTFVVTGNCSFNYQRTLIPITFSREFAQNESDLATLIHTASIFNNISEVWQQCERNLSICQNDVGYKGNYTIVKNELDSCYRARDDYSNQIKTLNEKMDGLTSWRNMGVGAGILGIGAAIYLFRKQSVKKVTDQYKSVPGVARQY